MYVPRFNAVEDDAEIRAMVAAARTAWLVTVAEDGTPQATLVPIIWEGSTVLAHVARANAQWRHIAPGGRALLVVTGPDAYISPSWYAAKDEHGKVVPTWNYTAVHLTGTVRVHHEPEWLCRVVTALTDMHERSRPDRWAVTDAPEDYIAAQLRAIVGIEVDVEHVDAKAKLSQNRSAADQLGVIRGLLEDGTAGATAIAGAMASITPPAS
jgi:transcriptional regulator